MQSSSDSGNHRRLIRLADWLIPLLLVPLPVAVLLTESLYSMLPFAAAAWALYRLGSSRTVLDPLGGVPVRMELSPLQFDAWARRVLTEEYGRQVREPPPGREPVKTRTMAARVLRAVFHVHARKALLLAGVLLNVIWLEGVLGDHRFDWMSIPDYAISGAAWGYVCGAYVRWRTCRAYTGGGLLAG